MLRKTVLAFAAAASLGAAALAPTAASAGYWHKPHGFWHGGHYAGHYGHCWRKKWVHTYYGWRLVRVNVCRY